MRSSSRTLSAGVVYTLAGLLSAVLSAAISIPAAPAYQQNFDAMGTGATATVPLDFRADRLTSARTVGSFSAAGSATTAAGGANLSTAAANGIYNFGAGTNATGPDRASGFLASGTTASDADRGCVIVLAR